MQKETQNLILQLARKLRMVIGYGSINHYSSDNIAQTTWDIGDDQKDETKIHQQFGLKTRAPNGTKCIGICNGNRENIIVISTDNKNALQIKEGESLLYSEESGKVSCHIHLSNDGSLTITAKKANINADKACIRNAKGEELLSLIAECLEKISSSKTFTSMGMQPLTPYANEAILISKKIKSFLEA